MRNYIVVVMLSVSSMYAEVAVPTLQLINKTGRKTGYPSQVIAVDVILGFDKSVYAHVDLAPFSSTPIKVPGIPGTFTLQYSRGGLMGSTDTGIIQVPVVEGTQLIFYDDSYEIKKPKRSE